ncbi:MULTISPECIES: membrane protein insertase YidC [Thiorhodovibrio]|uniref:membrane protein insertase YidC n=1 Tax=Thiorhodovibrio TaxID=61593 RepID=UPI00191238F7|nr:MULTISPECIES: membrane protein insertase YidC [Thiorhodovibrio]MBK5968999.1 membrane protein insertase YidC [Thiorhodovibrio winogradskyi]WPL15120.1 Oxa1Ec [Thiorhodovibrio litoralis]
MDNIRLILILAFAGVLFMIYSAWVQDYGPLVPGTTATAPSPAASPSSLNAASSDDSLPKPTLPDDAPAVATDPASSSATAADSPRLSPITVETDVLRAQISPQGATIENLWLLNYAATAEKPDDKFQLLKDLPPNMFIVQSGLLGQPQSAFPTHETIFSAEADSYRLDADQDEQVVTFRWGNASDIEVVKTYRFTRGSYLVKASQEIINHTDSPVSLRAYQQLQRSPQTEANQPKFVARTYTGGVYYGPEVKYKKEDFKEMTKQPLDEQITGGWIAMIQHYFLAAWVPPESLPQTFYTKVIGKNDPDPRYIIGQYSPPVTLAPGEQHAFEDQLFIGPKLADRLAKVAPGLHLAVDYGWLTILAEPIHWVLSWIHKLVGNWGWSIILLTILIKAAFYKLSETSYKSMAHMRKLTPRMKALKDRYGDDKERLNQAMMELYKKEKINPLGGCLPILVQIPVFIALYWVLLESVELRHAPFIFWLDNLTAPDPYYILPLIMGVSMFAQQKLNPPPPDPMQEKIMLALPVVFTVFFAFFPSGLVLYWTVNNLLSIAQQWYITRKIEQEERHKHA